MSWDDYFEYDGISLIRKPTGSKTHDTRWSGRPAGSVSADGKCFYIRVTLAKKRYYAHRVIYEMHYGEIPEGMQIDHADGDGTNNRLSNLRLVTCAENLKNQSLRAKNKTGVSGVNWIKSVGKYRACIQSGGKRKILGHFSDFFEAVCRRKSAESELGFHLNHGRMVQ